MGHPTRRFTEEEDALIRDYIRGTGRKLKPLAIQLHTSRDAVRRRAAELTSLPPTASADEITSHTITVGDDPLLRRLRKVHAERIR